MPLTITDFFEETDGFSLEDAPPEVQDRIDRALRDLTDDLEGPQAGPVRADPDTVVVNQDGSGEFETIQAAVDAEGTEPGDTILIEAGRYEPDEPIRVTDPGELRLVGVGSGSDPSSNTVVEQTIDVTVNDDAGNGVSLRDLRIENTSIFGETDGADLDAVFSASGPELRDVAVQNVSFVDNEGDGLGVDDTERLAVRNCLLRDNGAGGIDGGRLVDATVSNCRIVGNAAEGIDVGAVDSFTIRGCTVAENGVDEAGIEVRGDAADLTIAGSTLEGNGEDGVSGEGVRDATLVDTRIVDNGGNGIGIEGDVDGFELADTTVADNGDDGVSFGGGAEELRVRNTTIADNFGDGLSIPDGEVENGLLEGCSIRGNFRRGVEFASIEGLTIRDCTIENNIYGVSDPSLDVLGSSEAETADDPPLEDPAGMRAAVRDLTVERSRIADNGATLGDEDGASVGDGIRLVGNDIASVTVRESVVAGNGGSGVAASGSLDGADDVTVRDTTLRDNGRDGLAFGGVSTRVGVDRVLAVGNGGSGIRFGSAEVTDVVVERSNLVDNGELGVDRTSSSSGPEGSVVVRNCFFDGNEGGAVPESGVELTGESSSRVSDAGASL